MREKFKNNCYLVHLMALSASVVERVELRPIIFLDGINNNRRRKAIGPEIKYKPILVLILIHLEVAENKH